MTTKTAKRITGETIINYFTDCLACLYNPFANRSNAPTNYYIALALCSNWNIIHPRTTLNLSDLLEIAIKAHNAAHNTQITTGVFFSDLIDITK